MATQKYVGGFADIMKHERLSIIERVMDRGVSQQSTMDVSWSTKIRGAIEVGQGVGEAIRGSLGASDVTPTNFTSSQEIAQRGRYQVALGLARIRGVTTSLPPAPVYDRRHSHPVQQYEHQVLRRRSTSAHHVRPNPPTATTPFQKSYEHPYVPEPDDDSGFAGLGAGMDRKERHERVAPAFTITPPHPQPASTPYPIYHANTVDQRSRAPSSIGDSQLFIPAHSSSGAPRSTSSNNRKGKGRDNLKHHGKFSRIFLPVRRTRTASPSPEREVIDDNHTHRSAPSSPTPPPHRHEAALENSGYDILTYDVKDRYPHWPVERASPSSDRAGGARLEPLRRPK